MELKSNGDIGSPCLTPLLTGILIDTPDYYYIPDYIIF